MLQTIPNTDGIVILNDSWNRWTGFVTPSETFYLQFIYNTFANLKICCFGNEVRFPETQVTQGFREIRFAPFPKQLSNWRRY